MVTMTSTNERPVRPPAFPLGERIAITSAVALNYGAALMAWSVAPTDSRMYLALLLAAPAKVLLSFMAYRVWVRRRA